MALTLAMGAAALVGRATASSEPVAVRAHVVRGGETVWSIARDLVGPEGDPRPLVDALVAGNHLRGAEIRPGQRLVVPGRV